VTQLNGFKLSLKKNLKPYDLDLLILKKLWKFRNERLFKGKFKSRARIYIASQLFPPVENIWDNLTNFKYPTEWYPQA
jgi:hypothetical protein